MIPIKFRGANGVLSKPKNMTDAECSSLPVYRDGTYCVSCWELGEKELRKVMRTKKVFIGVLSGHTQPPIFLTATNPVKRRRK